MPRKEKTDKEKHPERYFESPKGHPRDRIIIHESPNIPREGQYIALNGYGFLVKAGAEIDLPRPVRKMLDTLLQKETVHGDDGRAYTREIPRFTYTLIKEGVNLEVPPEPVVDGG